MADHRLDRRAPPELAFDLLCDAPFLAGDIDPEPVFGRGVVAAIAGVGDDAVEHVAEERLHRRDHYCFAVAL